jgi:hypothetical protein
MNTWDTFSESYQKRVYKHTVDTLKRQIQPAEKAMLAMVLRAEAARVYSSISSEHGINITRHCVTGDSITAALVNSVTHVSFRWCIYVTSFQGQNEQDNVAMQPVAWVMGSVTLSITG